MFHAAGWTFPWANVFAFATQVRDKFICYPMAQLIHTLKITLRTVDFTEIWNHFLHSGVTHYCGAPTVQVCTSPFNYLRFVCYVLQIGIVNHPSATKLPQHIKAIIGLSMPCRIHLPDHKHEIAGSAPTAHLIGELEKRRIDVVHVYGLTCVAPFSSSSRV